MVVGPSEIVVLTDEPFHASYLATVLQLELPGQFRVRHAPCSQLNDTGTAALVLVQVAPGAPGPIAHLGPAARRAPVIVVSQGPLDLLVLGRLIQDGADDVIDLAQLNTRGLAAAVLKAVGRRVRSHSVMFGLSQPAAVAAV